jgi:putative endonuclease
MNDSAYYLYMIRCRDQSLYTGIALNVDTRFSEHQQQGPKCAKYLRGKGPFELVYSVLIGNKREALQAELRVKKMKKIDKEAMIAAENNK